MRQPEARLPRAAVVAVLVSSAAVLAFPRTAAAHEERDLVCGMMVDIDDAEFVFDYDGKTYYFCNAADLGLFRADPAAYAGALRLARESNGRAYECSVRPREPVAKGVATIVLTAPEPLEPGRPPLAEVHFVDRSRAPRPERIRLVPLPEAGKYGMKLALEKPGDVRILFRARVPGDDPSAAPAEDVLVFSFRAVEGAGSHEGAIEHAIRTGEVSMEAQHRSMAEMGELWTGVAKRLAAEPPDLEGAKEPLARIRALSRLMGGFELHRFPEEKAEMLAEASVFESAIVSLLRSVSRDRADEARERFATIDAMSCTKCHLKFRFGAVDDVSRFPDLREREDATR